MKPTSVADHPPRACIEEPAFAAQKAQLGVSVERLDEILDGLLLKIARRPEMSHQVAGTSLCTEISFAFPDAPTVIVTFAFDEEHVYLLWIDRY